jgi:hypothetical protein
MGVNFVDGQAMSGEGPGAPFAGGSMSSGGPVTGPGMEDSKSADISISGELPQSGNELVSPVDSY